MCQFVLSMIIIIIIIAFKNELKLCKPSSIYMLVCTVKSDRNAPQVAYLRSKIDVYGASVLAPAALDASAPTAPRISRPPNFESWIRHCIPTKKLPLDPEA